MDTDTRYRIHNCLKGWLWLYYSKNKAWIIYSSRRKEKITPILGIAKGIKMSITLSLINPPCMTILPWGTWIKLRAKIYASASTLLNTQRLQDHTLSLYVSNSRRTETWSVISPFHLSFKRNLLCVPGNVGIVWILRWQGDTQATVNWWQRERVCVCWSKGEIITTTFLFPNFTPKCQIISAYAVELQA